jgi:hypothetical protein
VHTCPASIEQALLHPSLAATLPSSQASLEAFTPSPQVLVQTLGSALLQVKPHSTEQLDEHPSPVTILPSSHASPKTSFPSPHTGVNELLLQAGKVKVQPASIEQALLHPSPATVLPSSHASADAFNPSPQTDMQFGAGVVSGGPRLHVAINPGYDETYPGLSEKKYTCKYPVDDVYTSLNLTSESWSI